MHSTVRNLAASLVKQRQTQKLQVLLKDHPQKVLVKEVVPLLEEADRQWFKERFVKTESSDQQRRTQKQQQNQPKKQVQVSLAVPAIPCASLDLVAKFHVIPETQELPEKWVRFGIKKGGQLVIAEMKRKTFNRFVRRTEELDDWIAAINGSVSYSDGSTIYLERLGTGIQVYEKKTKTETETDSTEKTPDQGDCSEPAITAS